MHTFESTRLKIKYSHYSKKIKNLRLFLLLFNGLCLLLAIAIIISGVVLVAQRLQFVYSVYGTQLLEGSCYLIIAAGCILFLVTFFGFYGALYFRRAPLLLYAIVLFVCFILGLLASCTALVFQYQVYGVVRVYMKESLLRTYGTNMDNEWNNFVTRSWDEIQQSLECCGLYNRGWIIYRQTFWYKDLPGLQGFDKPYVPFSCCKKTSSGDFVDLRLCQFNSYGPPGFPHMMLKRRQGLNDRNEYHNPALHTTGCYQAGKRVLFSIGRYFIAIGFIIAIFVSIAMAASFVMYNSI